jgi:hypothetical protein
MCLVTTPTTPRLRVAKQLWYVLTPTSSCSSIFVSWWSSPRGSFGPYGFSLTWMWARHRRDCPNVDPPKPRLSGVNRCAHRAARVSLVLSVPSICNISCLSQLGGRRGTGLPSWARPGHSVGCWVKSIAVIVQDRLGFALVTIPWLPGLPSVVGLRGGCVRAACDVRDSICEDQKDRRGPK